MFGAGYVYLLKRLNTTPPIDERVTKNERDILLNKEKALDLKLSVINMKAENAAQFNIILLKLEQIIKDRANDRISQARYESTIKRAEKHMEKEGLHEYRSYKGR